MFAAVGLVLSSRNHQRDESPDFWQCPRRLLTASSAPKGRKTAKDDLSSKRRLDLNPNLSRVLMQNWNFWFNPHWRGHAQVLITTLTRRFFCLPSGSSVPSSYWF